MFQKEEKMRILFSDEMYSDSDSVYNSQNDRLSIVDRGDADKRMALSRGKNSHRK